jgi:hypothetical protein
MAEAKVGQEFIKHELDEAIAVQQVIVDAEQKLGDAHPDQDSKRAIKTALKEDEKLLKELQTLGREHGATGKKEEVAAGLEKLMQETAQHATEAESEAYEAHAVLVNLKRKQQDSGSAMLKIAREMKDDRMKSAANEFQTSQKKSAQDLADQLAAFAVKIAKQDQPGARM